MKEAIKRMTTAERLQLLASDCRALEAHATIMALTSINPKTRANSAEAFSNLLEHLVEFWAYIQSCKYHPTITCPQCGATEPDFDGLGFHHCDNCGYFFLENSEEQHCERHGRVEV